MIFKFFRYVALAYAGLVALAYLAGSAQADPFETKRCVNMGNALDAPSEGEWGHTIDLANFARIRAAGFDTVRLPVCWSAHIGPDNAIDPAFTVRVEQVLNAALAADLNIVLNVHHFDTLMANPRANYNTLLDIWEQLALYYQTLPPQVAFEVMNEPNGNMQGNIMRRLQADAIEVIRQSNPSRTLILGGEDWSNIRTLDTNFMSSDPNVIYTFHYYDPFDFTHQNAPWTGEDGPKGLKTWGTGKDRRALRNDMLRAKRFGERVGKRVFLGEFGAYEAAPRTGRLAYMQAVRSEAESAGIGWCAWNFTATFPLFDDTAKTWMPGYLEALGLVAK